MNFSAKNCHFGISICLVIEYFKCDTMNEQLFFTIGGTDMKNILSISDSYEGTRLDVRRAVMTIKAYGLDPYIAIGEIRRGDGSIDTCDIKDTLDYCFGECAPDGVFVGFMCNTEQVVQVASELKANRPRIVVSDPSIISDNGEIWMSEDTYNVISTSIFDMSSHIVINHLEAELLAGFECRTVSDFERAAKKLRYCFDAVIYIKGCDYTSGKGLYCDDTDLVWIDEDRVHANPDYSVGSALNCELALGVRGVKAMTNAWYFVVNGRRVSDSIPVPQVAPSLISPAKSLRDIARSMEVEHPETPVTAQPAKTSIIDPITEGTRGTVSEIRVPEKPAPKSVADSLSELADIKKRLEALRKSM